MAWNQPSDRDTRPEKKKTKRSAVALPVIGVALLAVVGVLVVFCQGGEAETPKRPDKKPTKAEIPAPAPKAETQEPTPGQKIMDIIRKRGGRKNLTEEDKEEIKLLQAENVARSNEAAPATPKFSTPFECHTDQVIAMVLTAGESIPPFPGTSDSLDKEFVRSLSVPIVINDDDDEKTKEIKRLVIETRKEIDEQIRTGKSFRTILEEHRKATEDNAQFKKEALAIAREMVDEGETGMADEFVEKANEKLAEKGATPISRPLTAEERRERILQRKLDREQNKENSK